MPRRENPIRFAVGLAAGLMAQAALGQTTAPSPKQVIATPNAPAPVGPYSQAIRAGNMVFLAGQTAIDPASNHLMAGRQHRGSDPPGARQAESGAGSGRAEPGSCGLDDRVRDGPERVRAHERGVCHVFQKRPACPRDR